MKNIISSELIKLKGSWLIYLSIAVIVFFSLITLAMVKFGSRAHFAEETDFMLLLRQNHIFFTLMTSTAFFSFLAIELFYKEFQYNTISDILAVPVRRWQFIVSKELALAAWGLLMGLFSFLVCIAAGLLFRLDGIDWPTLQAGFWRYMLSAAISLAPLQFIILVTLLFKNYFLSLAVSIVVLVGSIAAFNTQTFIFIYPFTVGFVVTNFVEPVTFEQVRLSILSLSSLLLLCIPGILFYFQRMEIRS